MSSYGFIIWLKERNFHDNVKNNLEESWSSLQELGLADITKRCTWRLYTQAQRSSGMHQITDTKWLQHIYAPCAHWKNRYKLPKTNCKQVNCYVPSFLKILYHETYERDLNFQQTGPMGENFPYSGKRKKPLEWIKEVILKSTRKGNVKMIWMQKSLKIIHKYLYFRLLSLDEKTRQCP